MEMAPSGGTASCSVPAVSGETGSSVLGPSTDATWSTPASYSWQILHLCFAPQRNPSPLDAQMQCSTNCDGATPSGLRKQMALLQGGEEARIVTCSIVP